MDNSSLLKNSFLSLWELQEWRRSWTKLAGMSHIARNNTVNRWRSSWPQQGVNATAHKSECTVLLTFLLPLLSLAPNQKSWSLLLGSLEKNSFPPFFLSLSLGEIEEADGMRSVCSQHDSESCLHRCKCMGRPLFTYQSRCSETE